MRLLHHNGMGEQAGGRGYNIYVAGEPFAWMLADAMLI